MIDDMKKWGEMTDDEREDFLNNLDRIDANNDRKYRRHIINIGDPAYLAALADGEELPECHHGDKVLYDFYSGQEEYEGHKNKNPGH